ncbi:MAG TPA: hypothetical protein VFU53_00485 [Burkholderiales bacterium]|nr:hypothetical protein [Burkholderiales bacterium]
MSTKLEFTNALRAGRGSTSLMTGRRRSSGAGAGCAVALSLLLATHALDSSGDEPKVTVTDDSFKCITEMTKVRHFYVDNLLGNLAETVAVASVGTGDYPEGSVVQLMPNEVMIKQQKGYSPVTRDWEFFWIDVDKNGSKIYTRGFAEVNNRFGLNCFTCHVKARPEFDFICETEHGCDPIPVTKAMFGALQRTDPRCKGSDQVSAEDAEALRQLGELVKALTENKQ